MVQCVLDGCTINEGSAPYDHLAEQIVNASTAAEADVFDREIAGREAHCAGGQAGDPGGGGVTCWDRLTGVILLFDPGDEAMDPSAFTSTRFTATRLVVVPAGAIAGCAENAVGSPFLGGG